MNISFERKTTLSESLSHTMWLLLKNNQVNSFTFIFLTFLDFVYQKILVLGMYAQYFKNGIGLSIDSLFLTVNEHMQQASSQAVYIILGLLILVLIFFIFMRFANTYDDGHNSDLSTIATKVITLVLALLRTFPLTFIFQVLCLALQKYLQPESISSNLAQILVTCATCILLLVQCLYSAFLFNLYLPNTYIPWAEISSLPFLLEITHKLTLVLAYTFKSDPLLVRLFTLITLAILAYKVFCRIRHCLAYNQKSQTFRIITDSLLIQLLILFQFTKLDSENLFYLSLFLSLVNIIMTKFVVTWIFQRKFSQQFSHFKSETARLQGFINLLSQLEESQDDERQYNLSLLKIAHMVECRGFQESQQKWHKKQLELKEAESSKSFNKTLTKHFSKEQSIPESTKIIFNPEATLKSQSSTFSSFEFSGSQMSTPDKFLSRKSKGFRKGQSLKYQFTTLQFSSMKSQEEPEEENIVVFKTTNLNTVKHLFKYHLIDEQTQDFRIFLLRVYYMLRVMKNPYLAHFCLIDFLQQKQSLKFVKDTQKYLTMHFLHSLFDKTTKDEEFNLNRQVQAILDENSLFAKLDLAMIHVLEQSTGFWDSLLQERCALQMHAQGLELASSIIQVENVYKQLEKVSGDSKDIRMHLQMAAFYKHVLPQKTEYLLEIENARKAYQNLKLHMNNFDDQQFTYGKGLFTCTFDRHFPMKINFVNKQGCMITQYSQTEMLGMDIDALMLSMVAENHKLIVERFLKSGISYKINTRRNVHMKLKSGYIIPIKSYLMISYLNKQNMVFIFEYNNEFQPFKEGQTAFVICDHKYQVRELSNQCKDVCNLSLPVLQLYQNQLNYRIQLDDLFQFDEDCFKEDGFRKAKFALSKYDQYIGQEDEYEEETKHYIPSNNQGSLGYEIKMLEESYSDNFIKLKVFAIKKVDYVQPQIKSSTDTVLPMISALQRSSQYHSGSINKEVPAELQSKRYQQFEIDCMSMSQTSQASAYSGTVTTQFHKLAQEMSNRSTPKTLSQILKITLAMFSVVVLTSVVNLVLTMTFFQTAIQGFDILKHALNREQNLISTRCSIQSLLNQANGYIDYSKSQLGFATFDFFTQLLGDRLDDFKSNQAYIEKLNLQLPQELHYTNVQYQTPNKTSYYLKINSQNAVNLYINYGFDFYQSIVTYGPEPLVGTSGVQKIDLLPTQQAQVLSLAQRQYYFLVQNGQYNIFNTLTQMTGVIGDQQLEQIQIRVKISSYSSITCICIIALCGMLVIPLFCKVQNRVRSLMMIFFNMSQDAKLISLERVKEFKQYLEMGQLKDNQQQEQPQKTQSIKQRQTTKKESQTQLLGSELSSDFSKIKNKSSLDDSKSKSSFDEESSNEVPNINVRQEMPHDNIFVKKFKSKIKMKMLIQSLLISLLTLLFCSYFLTVFFMSNHSYTQFKASQQDLRTVYSRQGCAQLLLSIVQDNVQSGRQFLTSNGQDMTSYYYTRCQQLEDAFNKNIYMDTPVYLSQAIDSIKGIESVKFCDTVFGKAKTVAFEPAYDVYRLTAEQCATAFNGIATRGATYIYSYAYKYILGLKLDQEKRRASGVATPPQIKRQFLSELFVYRSMLTVMLEEPIEILQIQVKESVVSYFSQQSYKYIILFVALCILSTSVLAVFLLKNFKSMKHEMVLSNKLLLMIDIDSLKSKEIEAIHKFLNKY